MIKKIGRGICRFFIIGVAIIVGLFAVLAAILFVKDKEVFFLRHYAKTHTEFTLADALGDNWDVIYHDSYAYSSGSRLAEKYGFHYDGRKFSTEEYNRLFFIKDDKLRNVCIYNEFLEMWLPHDLEVITPQMVFRAQWNNGLLTLEPIPPESDADASVLQNASSTLPPEQPESISPADSTDLNSAAAENIEGPEVQSADIPPCEKVSYREDPVGCIRYFLWQKACEYQRAGFEDAFNGKCPPWNFTLGIADLNSDGVPELLFHDTGPGGKVYKLWLYDISGDEPVLAGLVDVGGSVTDVCQVKTDDGLPYYRISSCWGNSTLTSYTTAFIRALPDGSLDIWECASLNNDADGPQDTQGSAIQHNGEAVEDPERTISNALFAQSMTPCSGWFCRVAGFSVDPGTHTGVRVDPECTDPWWQSYAEAAVKLYYS